MEKRGFGMVDLKELNSIKLRSFPIGQWIAATFFLTPNYKLFSRVKIVIENIEQIPKGETVIYAMNHTDRYNYFPFQYQIYRAGGFNHTTIWTKGKYFHNPIVGGVLKRFGAIPLLSKGYLIEEFFRKLYDRKISLEEYRLIKDLLDKKIQMTEAYHRASQDVKTLLSDKWHSLYNPGRWQKITDMRDSFLQYLEDHYSVMMDKIAQMTYTAIYEKHLSLIVFPEGTRGAILGEGKTGIAQLALNTGLKVVPVGCNNSDVIYPGNSPIAKSGTVVYRIGEPLSVHDALRDFKTDGTFKLFSKESQQQYRRNFEEATRLIMDKINALLDEKYRLR